MSNSDYSNRLVGRWMSTRIEAVGPDTALGDAFEIMHNNRIRHLPVLDEGKLVGILSNRDLNRAAVGTPSEGKGFVIASEPTVKDVMTSGKLHTVSPRDSVRAAAEVICRNKISALLVVDGPEFVGLVTSEDLLWAFLEGIDDPESFPG